MRTSNSNDMDMSTLRMLYYMSEMLTQIVHSCEAHDSLDLFNPLAGG